MYRNSKLQLLGAWAESSTIQLERIGDSLLHLLFKFRYCSSTLFPFVFWGLKKDTRIIKGLLENLEFLHDPRPQANLSSLQGTVGLRRASLVPC